MRAVGQSIGHSNWVLELEWVLERHCARLHRRTFWPAISCVEVVFSLGPTFVFFVFFFIPIPKTENTPKKNAPGPPPTQLQSHVLFNTFFENKKVKEKETEPELDISVGVYRVFLTGFPEVGRRKWQLIGRHVVRFLLFLVSE